MLSTGVTLYVPAVLLPKRLDQIGITSTLLVLVATKVAADRTSAGEQLVEVGA